MNREPDFYLTAAGEYAPLAEPRACWIKRPLLDARDQWHLYVEIQPSFRSQSSYTNHVSSAVLSERRKDCSLTDITNWPAHVYVSEVNNLSALYAEPFDTTALKVIAWSRLHRTIADAERDAGIHGSSARNTHPSEIVPVAHVRFIGEQSGRPESVLKNRLVSEVFRDDTSILRAYLVTVDLGTGKTSIALCVRTAMGPDEAVVRNALNVFSSIFRQHEFLDILFLNNEQEQELIAVCQPFYP